MNVTNICLSLACMNIFVIIRSGHCYSSCENSWFLAMVIHFILRFLAEPVLTVRGMLRFGTFCLGITAIDHHSLFYASFDLVIEILNSQDSQLVTVTLLQIYTLAERKITFFFLNFFAGESVP